LNVFEAGTLGRVHDSTGSIVESSIGQNTNFEGTSTISNRHISKTTGKVRENTTTIFACGKCGGTSGTGALDKDIIASAGSTGSGDIGDSTVSGVGHSD